MINNRPKLIKSEEEIIKQKIAKKAADVLKTHNDTIVSMLKDLEGTSTGGIGAYIAEALVCLSVLAKGTFQISTLSDAEINKLSVDERKKMLSEYVSDISLINAELVYKIILKPNMNLMNYLSEIKKEIGHKIKDKYGSLNKDRKQFVDDIQTVIDTKAKVEAQKILFFGAADSFQRKDTKGLRALTTDELYDKQVLRLVTQFL